jgi:acetyl esterase/lipase
MARLVAMKRFPLAGWLRWICLLGCCACPAAAAEKPTSALPLWATPAPGALGENPERDIPTLTPYWPEEGKASGAAVVICPGGGYGALAPHEGRDYALWLAERGVTGFVLKYRLGSHGYRHPAMWQDASRALRLVRHNAAAWGLDPQRIGIMGSSAGGHLASTALTHFQAGDPAAADPVEHHSSRPDLGILCYPVISLEGPYHHGGSRRNLLGENPEPALLAKLSSEKQVSAQTPPCFLWHTVEDKGVPFQNSRLFADALHANGVAFELVLTEKGGHGLGLGVKGYQPGVTAPSALLAWTHNLEAWLRGHGFVR